MNRLTRLIFTIAAVLLACSCEHRELCYDHTHYSDALVVFDWTVAPEASPAVMHLVAFHPSNNTYDEYDLAGSQGGVVRAFIGNNNLVAYNGNTLNTLARGMQWNSYELYTPAIELEVSSQMFLNTRTVPRARGTEDEEVILQPDMLWTGSRQDVAIVNDPTQTVCIEMLPAVYTYTFTIRNVDNLEYVSSMTATLSGLSDAYWPALGRPSETSSMEVFDIVNADATTLKGTVRVFGHCPDASFPHKLVIYAILRDGTKWYYTFDVTDVIHRADGESGDSHEVSVVLNDGLPFPEPLNAPDNGMRPSIDEWQEVSIAIKMK